MRPAEDADFASRLDQLLDAAMELQGADFGFIELYNPERRTFRIVAHCGMGKPLLDHFGSIDANDPSGCIAMQAGRRVVIEYIDKEKRAEGRLQRSEERLNAAVELAGLGLYSVEIYPGGARLTWDNRLRSLWGLPADCEVTFDMWERAIHPDDLERVRAAIARAYDPSGDGVYDVEYRVLGADGVERWVATRAQTRFEHGQPVSLLGVARGITERKMIEHGLELVIDMRDGELQDVNASFEAEAKAHERVSERLELLQSQLSRGLFAAIENQRGPSPGTHHRVAEAARKIAELSPRERQVLDGLVRGEPHKQIAHRLGISARTVELHRSRMLHRLGTPHLSDAIRLAVLAELAAE